MKEYIITIHNLSCPQIENLPMLYCGYLIVNGILIDDWSINEGTSDLYISHSTEKLSEFLQIVENIYNGNFYFQEENE